MPTSELGSLKLTLQKFYRVNGGSTQLKGVQPNIILPDNYEFSKFREKDNPHSLAWDEIPMAEYKPWAYGAEVEQVARMYQPMVQEKDQFNKIRENAAWLSKMNEAEVSLNLVAYREMQKQIKQRAKDLESLQQSKTPISVDFMKSDEDRLAKMDKDKADRFRNWLKGLRTDIYLDETANVLNLLIEKDKMARK
jgi:carboxyl-terminal processing protease